MMYTKLSKKKATYIRQLALKKYRLKQAAFVIEGRKNIQALLSAHYSIQFIVGTPSFFIENQDIATDFNQDIEIFEVKKEILAQVSSLSTNHDVLAVVDMPIPIEPLLLPIGITLALDNIQDPGNLGTIIRIADWYGIKSILCSKTTVDLYNPKVLQASMGSFVKVSLHYVDLPRYLQRLSLPILGAMLEGSNVHNFSFPDHGVLVIGNESHGIHTAVKQMLTHTITIPGYGNAESLNAAIATAILFDNWKRSLSNLSSL